VRLLDRLVADQYEDGPDAAKSAGEPAPSPAPKRKGGKKAGE
jgi:hypothetical protein